MVVRKTERLELSIANPSVGETIKSEMPSASPNDEPFVHVTPELDVWRTVPSVASAHECHGSKGANPETRLTRSPGFHEAP